MNPTSNPSATPYEKVADNLIAIIEKSGILPWQKPWKSSGSAFTADGCPTNVSTKKPFTGGNVLTLAFVQMANGYPTALWGTFNQFKALGAFVKKGEKGTPILRPNLAKVSEEAAEESDDSCHETLIRGFTVYYVFNAAQTTLKVNIPAPTSNPAPTVAPIDAAETIMAGYKGCPPVNYGGNRAFYSPSADKIQLPNKADFSAPEHFYATAFHEMVHSTGHASRLNRVGVAGIAFSGDEDYSFEELIAEMGSCMLSSDAGILTPRVETNAVAYLQNWLSALKSNPSWLVKASQAAVKAAKFIRG